MSTRTSPTGPKVESWVDRLSGFLERHPRVALGLADMESRLLRDRLGEIDVVAPVYVTGLARSGSTILLELLARHAGFATHRYRDFPPVLSPVAWNWFVDRAGTARGEARERAHADGIEVTPESPEAFEEPVWMAFFPDLHEPGKDAVLDRRTSNPPFEAFYRDHIRKMLMVRGGERYLAKANYNITRIGYLLSLFPDARFVVPVREPVSHVASLMKQHELFCREGGIDPRVTRHMSRVGHFEFGLDRRAMPIDGNGEASLIAGLWEEGREIEGWAHSWAQVYGHLADRFNADPAVAEATLVVRYEDLCADPAATMREVLAHCRVKDETIAEHAAARVRAPDYYAPDFTPAETRLIATITAPVADRYGYPDPALTARRAAFR